MEQYLIDQYNVIEEPRWLKREDDIESHFMDCGSDFFECGQGYAQHEAEVICKVGDKFYEVNMVADIGSAKQEYGDRLFWVEGMESVTYKEIPKPLPKEMHKVNYSVSVTDYQKRILEQFLDDKKITWAGDYLGSNKE